MDLIELVIALLASGGLGAVGHYAITFSARQVAIQTQAIITAEVELKNSPIACAHPEMQAALAKALDDYRQAIADGKLTVSEILTVGGDVLAMYRLMKGS